MRPPRKVQPQARERWEFQPAPEVQVLEPGPVVLVDTREQTPLEPWLLAKGTRFALATERATVETGDYTIRGLEAHVVVERKSISDLVGTLVGSRLDSMGDRAASLDRFRRELDRMRSAAFRTLLVEGRREDIWAHRYESQVAPISILNLLDSFFVDYGVPTIWAGNREEAGRILGFVLHRVWSQSRPGGEAKKAVERGVSLPWLPRST